MRVLTWNLERVPRGRRDALEGRLASLDYDIAILTETRVPFVHADDVLAPTSPPPGRFAPDERKVAIWSRWGWQEPQPAPDGVLADRWVAGVTVTPAGPLRVVGLCIPYRFLWVRQPPEGEPKRGVWEEHLRFLEGVADALVPGDVPQVIGGDFNQRVPPVARFDRTDVVAARERAMAGHRVLTADLAGRDGRRLLCHLASTVGGSASAVVVDRAEGGGVLSDHHGALVTLPVP